MYPYRSVETDLLTIEVDILRRKAVVAIFVVRVTEVGCLLMYRPIGTPATPSGWYFCWIFLNYFLFRDLAAVRFATLQFAQRQCSFQFVGPFISCLIHFGVHLYMDVWSVIITPVRYVGCHSLTVYRQFNVKFETRVFTFEYESSVSW